MAPCFWLREIGKYEKRDVACSRSFRVTSHRGDVGVGALQRLDPDWAGSGSRCVSVGSVPSERHFIDTSTVNWRGGAWVWLTSRGWIRRAAAARTTHTHCVRRGEAPLAQCSINVNVQTLANVGCPSMVFCSGLSVQRDQSPKSTLHRCCPFLPPVGRSSESVVFNGKTPSSCIQRASRS